MSYRFEVDRGDCLNCGVCMDACPVQSLDMSRPILAGMESGAEGGDFLPLKSWMMEFPVQVGDCIGCLLCATECPTSAIKVEAAAGEVELAPRQGEIRHAPTAGDDQWLPLSALTTEGLKENHLDPWGPLHAWRPAARQSWWQSWRSWISPEQGPLLSPCQQACPVGTDAGLYLGLIAEGRYDEALAVAAEHNPFPSVCGLICTAPCEAVCRRAEIDGALAIRSLKRFAAQEGRQPAPARLAVLRDERVAIVGAGPAGLTAAADLAKLGYRVVVFEAMRVAGGMMAICIPEYRLPKRLLEREVQAILALGVELRLGMAMGLDFSLDDLQRQGYRAVFLATGAPKSHSLKVPGEHLPEVRAATVFLKEVNLGGGASLSGRAVIVGGGSTAMDAARSAWRCGASEVHVLYRRTYGRDGPGEGARL